jgi:CRISPR-associated protein Csd2
MTVTDPHLDPLRRQDFVLLFDVTDGNPNGDPDAGNLPRLDPETMQGLVTDVAIKRKVRDWVALTRAGQDGYAIYVQNEAALNTLHRDAYDAAGIKPTGSRQKRDEVATVRQRMAERFFDIRTFGAVMTTNVNAGQVRGPVQLTFARSVNPIVPLDVSITRIAITRPEDMAVETSDDGEGQGGKVTEMGRKSIVPYGLYRAHGFVNPLFATQTGFTTADLALVWEALTRMWDIDRSAARGLMSCRGLHIFSHTSRWGEAPAQALFERVRAQRAGNGVIRGFRDYTVTTDVATLPEGVTYTDLTP